MTKKEVEVELSKIEKNDTINLTENIIVEDILNILDVSLNPRVVNKNKVGNIYNLECELIADIYFEADNRNGLNVKNAIIPFMIKVENPDEVELVITKKQFTVNAENVNCDLEISIKASNNSLKNISVIEDIVEKELEDENDYKMFVYFVKSGDSVWKIAKHFKVPMCDIIELNNLENPEKIKVGDRLYIMK